MTQAQIGLLLQHSIMNEFAKRGIEKEVVILPSSVEVEFTEEMVNNPSKPVGLFYPEKPDAKNGIYYEKFSKGYRRVVLSPIPKKIIEANTIEKLIESGKLVIAVGGGGTPVIYEGDKIEAVDGVIDKDRASSILADQLNADKLIILTNVDGVYRDWEKPNRQLINKMNSEEADKMLEEEKELGSGDMSPKVEACNNFVKSKEGRIAIITSDKSIKSALKGLSGTHFIK